MPGEVNIDEKLLMEMMAGNSVDPGGNDVDGNEGMGSKSNGVAKERRRRMSSGSVDYMTLFFRNPESSARNGKSVYIRPEFHERLSRIVAVIGGDKLTIYAYLDNVLEYHFQQFAEEIVSNFNEKNKPIL